MIGFTQEPREDKGSRELISHIGPIPILIPLKLFLVTKFEFQTVISLTFSLLRSVLQGHSKTDIRHPIILTAKFGAKFETSFCRQKNVKIGKIKVMKFYRMTTSILLRKFGVIALKLNKLFEI